MFIKQLPNCFLKRLYYAFPYHYMSYNCSTSLPSLGFVTFLDFSHSRVCEVYPITVFICISLMANDVEHLYMYFYAVHISFFKEMSLKVKIKLSFSYFVVRIIYWYNFASIFSKSVVCLFSFLATPFKNEIFFFGLSEKYLPTQFSSMISSRFIILVLSLSFNFQLKKFLKWSKL